MIETIGCLTGRFYLYLALGLPIELCQQTTPSAQWRNQGGSVRSPMKKGKSGGKNFFGVKNLKTLKDGSLSVSVNSEPTVA